MTDPAHRDWDKKIKDCENFPNCAINASTKKSPFELLHGYQPRFVDGVFAQLEHPDNQVWQDPAELQKVARDNVLQSQASMKVKFDQHHSQAPKLVLGQLVFLRRPPDHTGEPTKTQLKYRGPLVITKVLPGDAYQVTSLVPTKGSKFFTTNSHIISLKPWGTPESDDLDAETDFDLDESEDVEVHDTPLPCEQKVTSDEAGIIIPPPPSSPEHHESESHDHLPWEPQELESTVPRSPDAQEHPGPRPQRRRGRPWWMQAYK
ncbi:hypothetical protein B566_EDAN013237 [Ephemera danica]|nr:hypothetical protein B566_EDAN013237 [Ephemera danica]